jgi:hypothetical protein
MIRELGESPVRNFGPARSKAISQDFPVCLRAARKFSTMRDFSWAQFMGAVYPHDIHDRVVHESVAQPPAVRAEAAAVAK